MTNTITIKTQAEFDALPNDFAKYTHIQIKNDPTHLGALTINRAWDSAIVVVHDSAHVVARDSAYVVACDSAYVVACDSAYVEAYGSAHVAVCGDAHVSAYDSSHVVAFDSSTVTYSGDLASFANWFSINKDDKYVVNQIKKQFANQPDYMRKINMVLIFS